MQTRHPAAAMLAAALTLSFAATAPAADGVDPFAHVGFVHSDPVANDAREAMQGSPAPARPSSTTFGGAVPLARLDRMRGGDGNSTHTTNVADLDGRVDGNTATDVVSGTNRIADGSFANAAGISTVIQNSGSNVLIQNSTIVNVQFVDPTP